MTNITLQKGNHTSPKDGMCLLEAVSYVAGEPFSDHPICVCPVLAAFGRQLNDWMPDNATRTRLLAPLIPRLVGTRSTPLVERARAYAMADWAVRDIAPLVLGAHGRTAEAATLRALSPVVDEATARAAANASRATTSFAANYAANAAYANAAAYAANAAYTSLNANATASDGVWESAAALLERLCKLTH